MQLYKEAERMLSKLQPYLKVKAFVNIYPAYSDGDDIVVMKNLEGNEEEVRLPMLRQQTPSTDGFCYCLSDFICPKTIADNCDDDSIKNSNRHIGVFAVSTSVDIEKMFPDNDYNKMLLQTLADRLAEAGAERLHEEVRKTVWGYAPHENLSMSELHSEKFQGIRPAIGYPCLPDISINFVLAKLVDFKNIGVTLTEHGMMKPHASVSGFMLSHPKAKYFGIGKIDETQAKDYAKRRGVDYEEMKKYLISNINI